MKHYIELVKVEKNKLTLIILDNVPTHDLDVLSHLKPQERNGWIEVHKDLIFINDHANFIDYESADWRMKRYGVYLRVVDTYE